MISTKICQDHAIHKSILLLIKGESYIQWTEEEKTSVKKSLFKYSVPGFGLPGKNECERAIESSNGKLTRRNWKDVKNYVYNVQ